MTPVQIGAPVMSFSEMGILWTIVAGLALFIMMLMMARRIPMERDDDK